LARQGLTVRRFLPGYRFISRELFESDGPILKIPSGSENLSAEFLTFEEESGVRTTLVVCDELFGRPGVYGPPGGAYEDNARRFAFFGRAVCEYAHRNHSPDVLHGHDWPAALVPMFARYAYSWKQPPKTVFTIHNMAYQGQFPAAELPWLSLGPELEKELFQIQGFEFYGGINFLKAGLLYADRLVTVSPTYAKDIRTPEYGFGLDGVIRERANALSGILNGADEETWDPSTDRYLPRPFDAASFREGKKAAKEKILAEMQLEADGRPLLSMVGRLADQKGIDVLLEAALPLLGLGTDLCILGDGDPALAEQLRQLRKRYPKRVGIHVGYNERLAHLLIAASDLVAVPSRHEPCGLTQMYAMRYGAIPVVHGTGGLLDTVEDHTHHHDRGTGFVFDPLNARALIEAVCRALTLVHSHPGEWKSMQVRAMKQDHSWTESARKYKKLYNGKSAAPVPRKSEMRVATISK